MSSSQPLINLRLLVGNPPSVAEPILGERIYRLHLPFLLTTIISQSLSLLQDLVQPITHDIALVAFSKEKRSRQPCPSCGAIHNSRASSGVVGKGHYIARPGQDIYGRVKQNASESGSYYECNNCARKVAASRYAAHLERCLGGRGARNKNAASTAATIASPLSLSPSSPYVTEDESPPTKPALKKRKVGNGTAKVQQHAQGVSTMPNSPSTSNGVHELDNHSDPGESTGRSSAKTVPGKSGEKMLSGMSSHHKSQVSKFLDRMGSPILQSTDNHSPKGSAGIKLENIEDE
ncbi:hypothetical protein POJ06DRAFT_289711 [Lipomyces tetrasporus]|uniref:SAGA-associated factor 11 n=1 Tax=Lipomyces tetrasporus TaxID=54092 RepID=A0AAD7VSN0_9ASCO|nr:uncharacterized protein POJ06DRAFT_289711 [Lipomyces tetrasporus]KAJ8101227.1 hypothetical protein POJ06DRAFT_289711 [Lipomyces tetrasporus]